MNIESTQQQTYRRQALQTAVATLPRDYDLRINRLSDTVSVSSSEALPRTEAPVHVAFQPALTPFQRIAKRIFDVIVTLMLLPIVLLLMGIIAIAIKLDSKGPVLFRQKRLGEQGETFGMYKFRSMVVEAEELQPLVNQVDHNGRIVHKHRDDPRVTRVGKFLRRWSLDEIPQFLNVLKGEMSIVGPRPELPWLAECYSGWQQIRFSVPQGITGWWQVNGRSDRMMHLHPEDDHFYVKNYSLWLDIYIVLKTPFVMAKGKGAY